MLASDQVAAQLPTVIKGQRDRLERMGPALVGAHKLLVEWSKDPHSVDEQVLIAMAGSSRPFALSLEDGPASSHPAPCFEPCTVVAADGSSIPVDRFAPIPCYVVNTGAVALPYGVGGEASLVANAKVGPSPEGPDPDVSGGGLELLRDVLELEAAAELAAGRQGYGAVAVLLDGTLLPWDLDSPQIDAQSRTALQVRTAAALDTLRQLAGTVTIGAYVSASAAADVATSIGSVSEDNSGLRLTDSLLFGRVLEDGERSSLFRARSERARRVEDLFSSQNQVCFFYLRVGSEIARVELPAWAATTNLVGRLHAVLLDQCTRGSGYPRALQEAHEQAVVSRPDRELFARLLGRLASEAGVGTALLGKAASKRRRSI